MLGELGFKIVKLLYIGQLTVEKQIGHFFKRAVGHEVVQVVATIDEYALLAIDKTNLRVGDDEAFEALVYVACNCHKVSIVDGVQCRRPKIAIHFSSIGAKMTRMGQSLCRMLLLVYLLTAPLLGEAKTQPYMLPVSGRHHVVEGRFHILVPSNWQQSPDKLMIVSLHGSGEDGGYIWNWDPFAETTNVLVLCPSSAQPQGWSTEEIPRILSLTEEVRQHYGATHVLLTGASAGAQMAFIIGLLYPQYFDGIQSFMGLVPDGLRDAYAQAKPRRKLPVLMIHGAKDPFIAMDRAKESYQWLRRAGFNVRLVTHAEMKHEHFIADNGLIYQWFLQIARASL